MLVCVPLFLYMHTYTYIYSSVVANVPFPQPLDHGRLSKLGLMANRAFKYLLSTSRPHYIESFKQIRYITLGGRTNSANVTPKNHILRLFFIIITYLPVIKVLRSGQNVGARFSMFKGSLVPKESPFLAFGPFEWICITQISYEP